MVGKLTYFAKTMYLFSRGVELKTARFFASWKGGGNYTRLRKIIVRGNWIFYQPTGISIPKEMGHYFSSDVNQLCDVFEQFNPVVNDGKLLLTAVTLNLQLKVLIASSQSLFVFREIFEEEVYGFALSVPCVVVDVGMNIGIASLFFASMKNVAIVHSFELIPSNYRDAKENFLLNPKCACKIQTYEYGWGTSHMTFLLDQPSSGVTDINIINALPVSTACVPETVGGIVVTVKDAAIEMEKILSKQSIMPVILKLDCEGAEYDIVPHLASSGILPKIDGVMIEWHKSGHEPITKCLLEAGMKIFYRKDPHFNGQLGMIYGWR